MNKFNKLRVQVFSYIGAQTNKIEKMPDKVYNSLRYYYHNRIPASFYLLFENMPENDDFLKNVLLTKYFPMTKDYQIIQANTKVFGQHIYIEFEDKVYDVSVDAIIDKNYYELMFGVSNKKVLSKDKIVSFMEDFHICTDDIYDCQDISFDTLDEIEKQHEAYQGKRKALIDRQVTSFFNDIHYEDGMLFIDLDHIK